MNFVMICSNEYAGYLATTIVSILTHVHKDAHCHFHIISNQFKDTHKQVITKLKNKYAFNIEYIQFDSSLLDRFIGARVGEHVTPMSYAKVFLPLIFPSLDKFLFLDIDLIVREDLSPLYETDISDYYFAAVEDAGLSYHRARLWDNQAHLYCNTGVLLVNAKKLREDNYLEVVQNTIKYNMHKYTIGEQDILNDAFHKNFLRLSMRWNFYHSKKTWPNFTPLDEEDYNNSLNNPAIIHYPGPLKPWHLSLKSPYKKEWKWYYKQSGFYHFMQEQRYKWLDGKCHTITICDFPIYISQRTSQKRQIKILGLPVYTKRTKKGGKKYYILGFPIYYKKRKGEKTNYIQTNNKEITQLKHLIEIKTNILVKKVENIQSVVQAQSLHPKIFSKYDGCHSGKDIVLVATGPSAISYQPIPDAIHVGVNGAYRFKNINFDYLFMQDNTTNQPGNESLTREVLEYNPKTCKKFLAIFPHQLIKSNIASKKPLYPLPTHAYNKENASPYILSHYTGVISTNLTLEPIANIFGTVFSAMQFILFTQPRQIYLVGCDCTNGYAYNLELQSYCSDLTPQIKSWEALKKDIDIFYPEIKITSINPVGLKGLFNDS